VAATTNTGRVVVSPDEQKLYVSVGSQSNVDEEPAPCFRAGDESGRFADLRLWLHPVGLDFHPTTGELYATVNERDKLGDDLVPL